MRGFNKIFLVGYLGGAPEILVTKSGSSYARLSLATHRSRKTEEGTWETRTDWHKVTVWGKKAELCADHLTKGSPLAVEGHLEQYKLEKDGQSPITQTSIVAEEVHFLPNPRQASISGLPAGS